ncbi:peptidylprolyl isomerase [Sphingomonas psychrotolerans]|uniref:peptidylprolyl isomerase n=1 Tax=Sphingomonas psychrotolerans TaxID=1327635 RepID=A0A2K8MG24_9SPHN|nr:peptidylprolyl isomerase [Sphingomonas psychrotolerans]ATY32827.1 peptidylprolyl isomerase [Sphingomonas psychrotolerans]
MLKPLLALSALTAAVPAIAQTAPAAPTAADAAASDWQPIPDNELLVMTLRGGHQVFIRLAPRYAPAHVANIRKLAEARWWDGTSVYRVQDNYVAQWGGGDDKTTLPPTVIENPPAEYEWSRYDGVTNFARADPYAVKTGHSADGWPLATDGKTSWLTHCYGMVGVARDLAPSTGSGAELYTVIGHAPRHLDRNIAIVGRVVEGIQWLSALPRGGGSLGVYENPAERVPILSARLASQLPEDERPHFQVRATDNERFAAWLSERENRKPPFFTMPAGGADICNAQAPIRRAP